MNVDKPGYLFVYLSNESNTADPVYFDDLSVTLTPGQVDAVYEYYPFGLATAESWERATSQVVDRKYQGIYSIYEKETGWHAFESRMYDAQIARWLSQDLYAAEDYVYSSALAYMGRESLLDLLFIE